jgi:PAS domain S-box-containing protein
VEKHAPGTLFQVFATDISDVAVDQARRAVYSAELLRGVSPQRIERFFEETRDGFKIRKELRERCIVSRHDVTTNPPFARLDLVSCRNVLIYFGPELQKRIVPIFHYALRTGGFLWLGRSETAGASSKLFSLIDKPNKIYSRMPGGQSYLHVAASRFPTEKLLLPGAPREQRTTSAIQSSADQLVLLKYGPPGVVVDHDLEILQFRGKTAPFLQPAAGEPTHGLLKMAHPDLLPALRALLQTTKKQNISARREGLSVETGGKRVAVDLAATVLNPLAPERERHYLVFFESASTPRTAASEPAPAAGREKRRETRTNDAYVEQLQQELDGLRDHEKTLVEQSEATQEELTSANEELQATNEEFQSTNEELETAKEELQSANEELTTMNDELQGRNAELVAVNEKLARGEDRFRLMVEGVKDYAIYMLDPEGRVTSWNEGARRLTGYEAVEVMGEDYSRFFLPEDIVAGAPRLELERARIDGRFEAEGWRLRKDRSRLWANVVVTRINDSKGTLVGYSKVIRDLTERRRIDEELEKSEQRFRLMISGVRDYAIFMLDPQWRVASWNEGARRLKGYEESEILGKDFSVFYPPEDIANGKLDREKKAVLTEGRFEDEGWRVRKDGSRFWASVILTRVTDARGAILGFTKVTRDLTEQKRASDALRGLNESLEKRVRERTRDLEQALKARDEFLSIASHELKTPLTSLKLQIQMALRKLERGTATPERSAATFDRALRQAVALEELVEDLLDVSRIQTGHFVLDRKPVVVSALIEEAVARFSDQLAQSRSRIDLRLEPGVTARWDGRRMMQVLVNLVSNALKYAPGSPIRISSAGVDGSASITVEDSGPGISEERQKSIFERFERAGAPASVGGLGLGLFIARRIVEAHHGSIQVESHVGGGTKFMIEIPRYEEESEDGNDA